MEEDPATLNTAHATSRMGMVFEDPAASPPRRARKGGGCYGSYGSPPPRPLAPDSDDETRERRRRRMLQRGAFKGKGAGAFREAPTPPLDGMLYGRAAVEAGLMF